MGMAVDKGSGMRIKLEKNWSENGKVGVGGNGNGKPKVIPAHL
jgi:hypothetical protein